MVRAQLAGINYVGPEDATQVIRVPGAFIY